MSLSHDLGIIGLVGSSVFLPPMWSQTVRLELLALLWPPSPSPLVSPPLPMVCCTVVSGSRTFRLVAEEQVLERARQKLHGFCKLVSMAARCHLSRTWLGKHSPRSLGFQGM